MQYFSRSLIASHLLNLQITKDLKILFIQRASELYLLANAIAINGDLLTGSRAINVFCNYQGKSLGPLARANVDLFLKVLELCDLSVATIDEMSPKELLVMKYSEEFIAFRRLYYDLVERAKNTQKDIADEIIQRFFNLKRLEKEKRGLVRVLSMLEFMSSGVFLNTLSSVLLPGFAPAAPAVILGSGVATSISHFLKKIKKIQETPILNFIDIIKEGKFRHGLYSNLLQSESRLK